MPGYQMQSVALTLSHGGEDASVEQMLFQFGALDVDPMNEVLMIECPIPPVQEWGTSIKRRFALLLEGDLRPQLFLSRRQLAEIRKTVGEEGFIGNAPARRQRFERMFPPGVRETIDDICHGRGPAAGAHCRRGGPEGPPTIWNRKTRRSPKLGCAWPS